MKFNEILLKRKNIQITTKQFHRFSERASTADPALNSGKGGFFSLWHFKLGLWHRNEGVFSVVVFGSLCVCALTPLPKHMGRAADVLELG